MKANIEIHSELNRAHYYIIPATNLWLTQGSSELPRRGTVLETPQCDLFSSGVHVGKVGFIFALYPFKFMLVVTNVQYFKWV